MLPTHIAAANVLPTGLRWRSMLPTHIALPTVLPTGFRPPRWPRVAPAAALPRGYSVPPPPPLGLRGRSVCRSSPPSPAVFTRWARFASSAAPLLDAGVGGCSVACGPPRNHTPVSHRCFSPSSGVTGGCIPSANPARRPVAARPRRAPLRGRLQCPRAGKRRPRRGVRPSGRAWATSAIGRVRGLRRARPARAGHQASAPGAGSRPHGPRPNGPRSSPRGHAQAALVVT